jgi:hypothetical protein
MLLKCDISDNAYEHFDLPTVGENIYRSRRGINRKEQKADRKMCTLVITECGLRVRRVRNRYLNKNP